MREYIVVMRKQAQRYKTEYTDLCFKKARLDMQLERTANYIEAMNEFLKTNGGKPIEFIR